MNRTLPFLAATIVATAAGCTMIPGYHRPKAPVPEAWPSGPAYSKTSGATTDVSKLKWQDFFTDKNLKEIIGTALANNRDLRIAALNVRESRANYQLQRAELLPVINATAGVGRYGYSSQNSSTGSRYTYSAYNSGLNLASWELDFFGRLRSLKGKALETYLASEEGRRSTQVTLIASIANAYLTLAADRENLKLSQTTAEAQQRTYELVKKRYDLGLAQELDLYQAQTPVDTARREVVAYTQQVAQDENSLALLVGGPVPARLLPSNLDGVSQPKEIASGIHSEVLLTRPDVLQAEHQLKAANANIGAARAAFFPSIDLTGSLGLASGNLSKLFKAGADTWSFGPQASIPIFDARTLPSLRITQVDREITVAQYEKAIQSAFKEVADALAVRGTVGQELKEQQSLVNALSAAYRLSNSRYEQGIDDFLNVLDAQRSLFSGQQVLVTLRLSKLTNQVKLYSVLGGGGD
ncbi:MAG: efflux transporter outer membrane subunit [Chthoniobacteraceae bacterium]